MNSHVNIEGDANETGNQLLLLPCISAQACPITVIRENSVFTKRISYSENLKERSSFLLPRHDELPQEKTVQEHIISEISKPPSEEQARYISLYDPKKCCSPIYRRKIHGLSSRNPGSSSSLGVFNKSNHSFRECQQFVVKLKQKMNNKSLQKSRTSHRESDDSNESCRRKAKQKLSNQVLFTNYSSRNCQSNPYYSKQCGHHSKRKKAKKKKDHEIENKIKDICKETYRCRKILPVEEESKKIDDPIATLVNEFKNVFYSEKQSLTVDGLPAVPPTTPNGDVAIGIASLSDIKSQRCIQNKLKNIRERQMKREREIMEATKAEEMQQLLTKRKELTEKQRRQIYAINKVLADIENENFLKFKAETKGVPV